MQHQTLSTKIGNLNRDVESLRHELEEERLSKERELQKMTTMREKEVVEHKKQLASIRQELEAEKQKPSQKKVTHHILCLYSMLHPLNTCVMYKCMETNSQLKIEREGVEMKTRELTA